MAKFGMVGALEYELVGERANALGLAGRRLRGAIESLQGFDAQLAAEPPKDPWAAEEARALLVREAATRLWELIVHREACGFTQHDPVYEIYEVPREIRARV